jgi:acyl dehydratase
MTTPTKQAHREITDEDIRLLQNRIGVELPKIQGRQSPHPHNEFATPDGIRRYAEGIGDNNPLFNDRKYSRSTRWSSMIAPPLFIDTMGVPIVTDIPPEVREAGKGALSGVHAWQSGDTFMFHQPVHDGDRMTVRSYLKEVQVKKSEFAGRVVHQIMFTEWTNQRGVVVATADRLAIHGGRAKAPGERTKYADLERKAWTPDEIDDVARRYRAEKVRGAETRYWEDVKVGEVLPSRIKGPLTLSDEAAFTMGRGSPFMRSSRLAFALRDSHPNVFPLDRYGVPDVAERVHFEDDLAIATGNIAPYDYGPQREGWMAHVVTDWMGDDGFVRAFHAQLRKFNYLGDLTECKGVVESTRTEGTLNLVRVTLTGEDHRGRTTCVGWADVALPTRAGGPVCLLTAPSFRQDISPVGSSDN